MCKRGEVYYIRYNDAIGSEQFVGRPGIIVSSDVINEKQPTVAIVYTSTQPRSFWFTPELTSTSKRSWALCEQIVTVDKMRLGDRMCVLTEEEMVAVDDALRGVLGLDWPEADDADAAAEEPVDEMDELAELRVEAELYHKMYDKLMDKMVEWYGEKRPG